MASAAGIISNTGEDFVDELVSNVVYRESTSYIQDIKKHLDLKEGDVVDEAIDSALTTFQYGVMNAVIMVVTEYAMAKSALILTGLFLYIKSRGLVKKAQAGLGKIIEKVGKSRGKALVGASSSLISLLKGSQAETLAMTKMTNDSANNIVTNVLIERQNQILLRTQKLNRIDATKSNLFSVRNKARDKDMQLFVWKTTNGKWEKTQKDEKLYENCVGEINVVFNAEFVSKLNALADVVKTAKGDIISRAQTEIDLITAIGANVKG